MKLNERLQIIENLCELNISSENNLKDIKHHISEIKKELNISVIELRCNYIKCEFCSSKNTCEIPDEPCKYRAEC